MYEQYEPPEQTPQEITDEENWIEQTYNKIKKEQRRRKCKQPANQKQRN